MATVVLVAVSSFSWGVLCSHYQVFPFQQLVSLGAFLTEKHQTVDDEKHQTHQTVGDEKHRTVADASLNDYPHWKDRATLFSSNHLTAKNVMLGDSITEGGDWFELLQGASVLNRGIGGDTTYGVTKRLDSIISIKPHKAFVGRSRYAEGSPC